MSYRYLINGEYKELSLAGAAAFCNECVLICWKRNFVKIITVELFNLNVFSGLELVC